MNENYNQSYTREEIAEYLNTVRECVENGNFNFIFFHMPKPSD